jgi:ATP-dependent helicase YprA (DUF1998 family)
LKAVAKLGWLEPTPIQEKAIPILLEGKDVLLRARTGSGKTGAFAIPVIQRILNSKQVSKSKMTCPVCQLCNSSSSASDNHYSIEMMLTFPLISTFPGATMQNGTNSTGTYAESVC